MKVDPETEKPGNFVCRCYVRELIYCSVFFEKQEVFMLST